MLLVWPSLHAFLNAYQRPTRSSNQPIIMVAALSTSKLRRMRNQIGLVASFAEINGIFINDVLSAHPTYERILILLVICTTTLGLSA